MIAQGRWRGARYALSLKASSLSLAIHRDDIVVCDRAGRLYSVYRNGRHHRRSLSGPILQKWTIGERQRRWLNEVEADRLIDWAAAQFRQLAQALRAPDWEWTTPPDCSSALDDLFAVIERAARFDSAAARLDAARFAEVYSAPSGRQETAQSESAGSGPIGILPPDQYLALVLQATDGCSFNTCTFCDLYRQPFRVKTPAEFHQHIEHVRAYLGESITLRQRSIFLGAANALAIPMTRLLPIFEIIHQSYHSDPERSEEEEAPSPHAEISRRVAPRNDTPGIYAFLDAFTGARKTVGDYQALAKLGLRRVYIGLESGHDPLLEFVRKPGHAQDALETVRAIKSAGVHVGVIVMIGLGGDRYAAGHVADTLRVLNALQLGEGDLLYLSDLVEEPGTPYPRLAQQHGLRALDVAERTAQRTALRRGLQSNKVKISNYDVREFLY